MTAPSAHPSRDLSLKDFRSLAELRHQIRRFLHFSEEAAREHGVEPQQHQLLLAIKGLPAGTQPTIREIAGRLQLRHHSVVELVNRLTEHGAIARRQGLEDRREVLLELTATGDRLLHSLSVAHREELRTVGPGLKAALDGVLRNSPRKSKPLSGTPARPRRNGVQPRRSRPRPQSA